MKAQRQIISPRFRQWEIIGHVKGRQHKFAPSVPGLMNTTFEHRAASDTEHEEYYWSHGTPARRMSTKANLSAFTVINTQARREIISCDRNDSNVHIQERLGENVVMQGGKKAEEKG